jgi:hypothetical protein
MRRAGRNIANACVLAMIPFAFLMATSHAAVVSCSRSWGDSAVDGRLGYGTFRLPLLEVFPSGRRPTKQSCKAILIQGPIEPGDAQKFMVLLRQHHPFVDLVTIASSGGSVEEAIKIGRLIRRFLLITQAPYRPFGTSPNGVGMFAESGGKTICEGPHCNCASSCFLIWAGGYERLGHVLGVHAPSNKSTAFSELPADRASRMYRDLVADIGRYLEDVDIPRKYRDLMSDTSSSDMRWLTLKEAESLTRPSSIWTWIASSCEVMSQQEQEIRLDLLLEKNRSSREELLYEALERKFDETSGCLQKKMFNARDMITRVDDPN